MTLIRADSALVMDQDALVARQAIVDAVGRTVGYELLFRHRVGDLASGVHDSSAASRSVILDSFLDLGLERIVGDYPAFLNLTADFFLSKSRLSLPKGRVVLEVLENVAITPALIEGVRRYADLGYRIALDDFVYSDSAIPLLELPDIVKLDVLAHSEAELRAQCAKLAEFDLILLAEKIETHQRFEMCKDLGFDLFQGYFLHRPETIRGQRLPANRLALLRLLARLQDPAVGLDEIEQLVREDVTLCYKLLRLINSAYYGLGQKIESIRQTLVLLGGRNIRAWVSLLSLSTVENKPADLLLTAMVRARMCEELADRADVGGSDSFFTVGLFSILAALLDAQMAEILATLPLSRELEAALLENTGPMGEALACVLAYERGAWDLVGYADLAPAEILSAYVSSVEWAEHAGKQLGL